MPPINTCRAPPIQRMRTLSLPGMQEPLLERRLCANGRMEWRFQDHEARQKSLAMSSDLALHGIEIRSAGNGSGLGVFALRPFQPGARIFGESPLVQWTSADQVECPGVSYAWLQRQLERLPPADQAAYAALYASPAHADKGPALAIWISNAYPGEEDGDGDSAAVFCIGSRFNHGCSANCATSWDSRLRRQMYHAVKPIGSGEEITVNYLGQAGHVQGRDARMAGLRKVGFECSCALCVLSTSARIASDARRSRMASLRSQLEQERRRGAEGGLYEHCACLLEKLLSLMREEVTRPGP